MTGAMRAVLLASLLAIFFPVVAAAQDANSLFDEGVELWLRNHNSEAVAKFKEVLSLNPSSEEAYQMLEKAEYQIFLTMIAAGGDAEQIATRLLDLSRPARFERRREPARIKELVEGAIHGADFGVRRKAILTIQAEHGEYAVPGLAAYLGTNDIDERTNAIIALTSLGSDAVLPLIEALDADNVEVVRNGCAVLARLKDQRSIPALMAVAEGEDSDELAQNIASEALADIQFDKGYGPADAVDAYLHLAQRYYEKDPGVIVNFDAAWTLWSWKDGALASRQVPSFLYAYELAEECAHDALAIDPASIDARIQLVLVAFAEKACVDALGDEANELKAKMASVTALAAAQGTEVLNGAALRAISWCDAGVACAALTTLAECWGDAEVTEECALIQGLQNETDKSIRYAAALALLKIAPKVEFPCMEMIVPIMADAVAEGSVRQILVIEPNPEIRTFLLHTLNGAGYYAVAADSGASGLLRAKAYSVFDLIIVNASLPDITTFQVVKELSEDFRTSAIPYMVTNGTAKLFPAAAALLKDAMQPDLYLGDVKKALAGSPNDDRAAALALSLEAASTLAGYGGTMLDLTGTVEALTGTLTEKPDNIRLAALAALASFGTQDAEAAVLAAFTTTANSTAIRTAAAKALGDCLKGLDPTAETFAALMGGMGEADLGLRIACGGALGKMALTPEQGVEVMTARRID
jgi:HEAT repeat protein